MLSQAVIDFDPISFPEVKGVGFRSSGEWQVKDGDNQEVVCERGMNGQDYITAHDRIIQSVASPHVVWSDPVTR